MKKSFLLIMAAALSIGASAQSGRSVLFNGLVNTPEAPGKAILHGNSLPPVTMPNSSEHLSGGKTTTAMDRWYSYTDIINAIKGNAMYSYAPLAATPPGPLTATNVTNMFIWFDSTITQRFRDGSGTWFYGQVNFSSVAMTIYPPYVNFQDTANVLEPYYTDINGGTPVPGLGQLMAVKATDAYQVDTVWFYGAYSLQKPSRHTADSLIISVVPSKLGQVYGATGNAWISHYTGDTSIVGYTPDRADSVRHAAASSAGGVTFAVAILPDSTGDSVRSDGTYFFRYRKFGIPSGPVNIPAGYAVSVSVTFKSTASYTPNVDSVEGENDYRPMFAFEDGANYQTYWPDQFASDSNGTSIMFSTFGHYKRYDPAIEIEGFNNRKPLFWNYLWGGAHLLCNTCNTIANTHTGVGVRNVTGALTGVTAYPNPAVDQVAISYVLPQSSSVQIKLTNTIGQVVATQQYSNTQSGRAMFNVSNLATGVYFYTVEANGERSVGRLVVAH